MQTLDVAYCNAAIRAVLAANGYLMQTRVEDVLKPVPSYGKRDTLDLDARSEILIREQLGRFDQRALLITEEQKVPVTPIWWTGLDSFLSQVIFFSDPIDGSKQLKKYFSNVPDQSVKVADVVRTGDACLRWEQTYSAPAIVTGATSSVTCVIGGLPICSAIVNCITQHLFVACAAGIRMIPLPSEKECASLDLDHVLQSGEQLHFPPIEAVSVDQMRAFLTFLDKEVYKENFLQSELMSKEEMQKHLHTAMPVGPSRILFLSRLQSKFKQLGFILANGEKIGEWVHWLPYVRYATLEHDRSEPALKLFEVYQERPGTRNGVLMAPPPAYSPFNLIPGSNRYMIDPRRLSFFEDPSKVRATLIVTPRHNQEVRRVMEQHGYRRVVFPLDN